MVRQNVRVKTLARLLPVTVVRLHVGDLYMLLAWVRVYKLW